MSFGTKSSAATACSCLTAFTLDIEIPLGFSCLDHVPDRRVGWVWLQVVCRWVALDELPPGQPEGALAAD